MSQSHTILSSWVKYPRRRHRAERAQRMCARKGAPLMRWLAALLLIAGPANAQDNDFDYYVMALSWSPSWCALEGDARDAEQCDPAEDFGFTLHGLWPQFETGYPSDCRTSARDPSRRETAAMADIMGSGGLAWHQWKKHGRCSGLSSRAYFEASRTAYESISRPALFRQIEQELRVPPKVVEEAFLEANPSLLGAGVTVTCRAGRIQEVRICLNKDLSPRICGRDVQRDCAAPSAAMPPVR